MSNISPNSNSGDGTGGTASPISPPIPKKEFKIKFPMSNKDVLSHLSKFLRKSEKSEIVDYPIVYFLNIIERKMEGGTEDPKGCTNDGYDNSNGEY